MASLFVMWRTGQLFAFSFFRECLLMESIPRINGLFLFFSIEKKKKQCAARGQAQKA
jgi:hypothetical protein